MAVEAKRVATLLAWALAATVSSAGRAEEPSTVAANVGEPEKVPDPTPKRAIPDYDGRGAAPPDAGDVALWGPRVVLSPLYLVSEYVVRWPLSVAIPAAERDELPRKIYDFFTFGPDHKAGFAPVGFFEFGFNPSVGVYAFWNDAGFAGDDWHAHVEVWPTDWLAASVTDRIRIDELDAVQFRIEGLRRPDHVFYGLGPDTPQADQSRYGEDRVEGSALYERRFWRASRIQTAVGVRSARLYEGHYGTDPGLQTEAATGAFALPAGFGTTYVAETNRALLVLDTREPWPAPGSGFRAELQAEQGNEVRQSPASGWIRYGATAGGYIDLNHHGRVVALAVTALFADPLANRAVPFTELASLGGDGPMRGYYSGRLVDRSAIAASAHYVWPLGPWFGGTLQAAVGNVFEDHLRGFRPGRLRFSSDVGLTSLGGSDYPVELIAGLGSETFERGGSVDSFRLSLSVNHGF
jgi:hypothetical protein